MTDYGERIWGDIPDEVTGQPAILPPPGIHKVRVDYISDTQESEDGQWIYVRVFLEPLEVVASRIPVTLFHPASPAYATRKRSEYIRAVEALNAFIYATGATVSSGRINFDEAVGKECIVRISHRTNSRTGETELAVSFRGPAPSEEGGAEIGGEEVQPPF